MRSRISWTYLLEDILFTNSLIMLDQSTDLAEFNGLTRLPQVNTAAA
jgi:hypothetical protein